MSVQPPERDPELPVMDQPYVPPAQEGPKARFRLLPLSAPLRWLALGFADLRASPGIALFYGTAFWFMAQVLATVFRIVSLPIFSRTRRLTQCPVRLDFCREPFHDTLCSYIPNRDPPIARGS